MNSLLAAALLWTVLSLLLLWRLTALLRQMATELDAARRERFAELERYTRQLTELMSLMREQMQRYTQELENKAESVRALLRQAEQLSAPRRESERPRSSSAERASQPHPSDARQQEVLARLESGEQIEEIARQLRLSQREIDLIARMHGRER